MPATAKDLEALLLKLRYDTTAMQAKITDALTILSSLSLKEPAKYHCDQCVGGLNLPSQQHLTDHHQLVHDTRPTTPFLRQDS